MPAYRPAYFFSPGCSVPTKLAKDLEFAAETTARHARALGYESHSKYGRNVIIKSWPNDFVRGLAHRLCDRYKIDNAWTLEPAMTPCSVITTVNIQFLDDWTYGLALMCLWAPNASSENEANIWRLRDPIPGYSSIMVDFRFGQIKPPHLHREPILPIAPNTRRYPPAISQALAIGREDQRSLFPRPFLLYGSLEDPSEIANRLRISPLPLICKGLVRGFQMMLCGIKPAVVFGSWQEIVHGVIYVVQSREDAEKLRPGKNYRALPCSLRLHGAPCWNHPNGIREIHQYGAIFRWVGDHSKFSVRSEQDIAVSSPPR